RRPDDPEVANLRWLIEEFRVSQFAQELKTPEPVSAKRGCGCSSCNGTGYSGRQGVYELLEMDAVLAQAASRSDPAEFMRVARERMKGQTMAYHVLQLVRQGRTSLAEALRIGFDVDEQE
ncbi:MAG: DUF3418 domain-containing protein, partial [Pseudomonadota bacterium]